MANTNNISILSKYRTEQENAESAEYTQFMREYAAGLNAIVAEARSYLETIQQEYGQQQGGAPNA